MKKFCISASFILIVVFVCDRLLGQFMHDNMKYSYDSRIVKLYYETTDISEDVICLGSSRCEQHYVPSIIADSLNCTVYNAGWSNSRIYAYYYILHQILRVHTPKLICLDVKFTDYMVREDDQNFAAVMHYAPCFGRVAEADAVFWNSNDYIPFMLSSIYRYNTNMMSYVAALLHHAPYEPDINCGYKATPRPAKPDGEMELIRSVVNSQYDSLKIYYFEQFIELCRKHDIELVISVSPYYSRASADLYDKPKEIAKRYGVPVFDYHSKGLFLDHPEYFRDKQHLYDEGARIFTSIFAHDLKEYLDSLNVASI